MRTWSVPKCLLEFLYEFCLHFSYSLPISMSLARKGWKHRGLGHHWAMEATLSLWERDRSHFFEGKNSLLWTPRGYSLLCKRYTLCRKVPSLWHTQSDGLHLAPSPFLGSLICLGISLSEGKNLCILFLFSSLIPVLRFDSQHFINLWPQKRLLPACRWRL